MLFRNSSLANTGRNDTHPHIISVCSVISKCSMYYDTGCIMILEYLSLYCGKMDVNLLIFRKTEMDTDNTMTEKSAKMAVALYNV